MSALGLAPLRRLPAVVAGAAAVVGPVAGIGWAVAAPATAGDGAAGPAPALATGIPPPPTATPDAPGIVLADGGLDQPDPFLLDVSHTDYLYLSTALGAAMNVPVQRGGPGGWGPPEDALPTLPPWAVPERQGGETWAPEVHRFGDRWVLYFSAQVRGSDPIQHCIGTGTSTSPAGPFVPDPTPLVCQWEMGGDIDAQVFVDPTGPDGPASPDYLVWKSDQNSTPGSGATVIWAQHLASGGRSLTGSPVPVFEPDRSWQGTVVEAPQMTESPGGQLWLFYSAGVGYFAADYAVGAARCAGPLGPCADVAETPLLAGNAQGQGPGEETVFVASDGSTWLLYDPWCSTAGPAVFRPAEAARVGWDADGPYVAAAGAFPPP